MKYAKVIAWLGLVAMITALYHGFMKGNFSQDGAKLLANPWGIVSLVDLYVGFTLFSLWIVFREKNHLLAIVWIVLMMVLGFFAGSLYVILTLWGSKGNWLNFFLGSRKDECLSSITAGEDVPS